MVLESLNEIITMNKNSNWDVDQHKTEHECDEHWALRRSFMVAHKDKFSEERLVCLAQVFTNVEFLGCRYPAKTMQLVANLAQGVADEYRQKQKNRLQRTFVQASDAAGAKAKGLKRPLQESEAASTSDTKPETSNTAKRPSTQTDEIVQDSTSPLSKTNSKPDSQPSTTAEVTYGPPLFPNETKNSSQSGASTNGSNRFNVSRYGGVKTYHIGQSSAGKSQYTDALTAGPYGKLILIEPVYEALCPQQIISTSAAACRVPAEFKYESEKNMVECKIFLNGRELSSGEAIQKKSARSLAAEQGLQKLKEVCYTLKVKAKILSETTVEKSLTDASSSSLPDDKKPQVAAQDMDTPLTENNIGSKLLKMMGWSGGGLGKNAQGIEEPISVQKHVNRAGLGLSKTGRQNTGLSEQAQVKANVRQMIQEYARNDNQYDLVFSSEFTKDERKTFHQFAQRFKLKTKSYGGERDRYLVISKKRDIWQTVTELIESGGSTERYELERPLGSI